MHKFIFYLLVCVSGFSRINCVNFCESNVTLAYVFTIGDIIYFGNDTDFWLFSILDKQITENKERNSLFNNVKIESIVAANIFDYNPCASFRGDNYCNNAREARNLVQLYGQSNGYTYSSLYRLNEDRVSLTELTSDSDVPITWSIPLKQNVTVSQYKQLNGFMFNGFTFASDNINDILYASSDQKIYIKRISEDGILDSNWTPVVSSDAYLAIFDVWNIVFTLDEQNFIQQLEWINKIDIRGKAKFDTKEFFNCNGNTPLINYQPFTTSSTSNSLVSTEGKKSDSKWWLFLIIGLIALAIIAAIIYFIYRQKSQKNLNESSESDSKVSNNTSEQTEETAPLALSSDKSSLGAVRSNVKL